MPRKATSSRGKIARAIRGNGLNARTPCRSRRDGSGIPGPDTHRWLNCTRSLLLQPLAAVTAPCMKARTNRQTHGPGSERTQGRRPCARPESEGRHGLLPTNGTRGNIRNLCPPGKRFIIWTVFDELNSNLPDARQAPFTDKRAHPRIAVRCRLRAGTTSGQGVRHRDSRRHPECSNRKVNFSIVRVTLLLSWITRLSSVRCLPTFWLT